MDLIDDIIAKVPDDDQPSGRRNQTLRVDEKLLFCPVCRRGYEWGWVGSSQRGWVYHPVGMIPSYGKVKKKCIQCDNNQQKGK